MALRSAWTISLTRLGKSTLRFQPRSLSALAGLPRRRLRGEKKVRNQRYDEGDRKGLLDFSGTEVLVIYLDDDLSRLRIDTLLFDTFTPPSATTQSMGKESGRRG